MTKHSNITLGNERPNILMIMVDQMHYPRYTEGGFNKGISDILGFKPMDEDDKNAYTENYPGFTALRNNAVVLKNHRIATSACVPSRTAIFSGQYGTQTDSTQTDGIFKSGTDDNFPWLNPQAMPTIGSYMRSGGYNSFYMGKWHISGEKTTSLEEYGFADWELSYPDPHGYLPNNLGFYRDYQFRDLTTSFLRRQGLGQPYNIAHAQHNAKDDGTDGPAETTTPWFAVCSFANPHDIASYPGLPSKVCDDRVDDKRYTLKVPEQGKKSNASITGTMKFTLNSLGLEQNNAQVAPSWSEDILTNNKPDCQFDYSYKMGLSLLAGPVLGSLEEQKFDSREDKLSRAVKLCLKPNATGLPIAMTEDTELASKSFMQYYAYLFSRSRSP